eukprot:6195588-Pleurochrysis_carterae.AAC.3
MRVSTHAYSSKTSGNNMHCIKHAQGARSLAPSTPPRAHCSFPPFAALLQRPERSQVVQPRAQSALHGASCLQPRSRMRVFRQTRMRVFRQTHGRAPCRACERAPWQLVNCQLRRVDSC